jgi:hypothetical protein
MTSGPHRPRRLAAGALAAACAALTLGAAGSAAASTTWLCRPGLASSPCKTQLGTTIVSATGDTVSMSQPVPAKTRTKVDCFYVYPTVSDQTRPQATKHVDPEERSIALFQAARYSSVCRVFAPMYRQVTLRGLLAPKTVTPKMLETGYRDVRDAWREYLRKDNKGHGVVLIGHSQGTYVLRRLVTEEIDAKPAVRRKLISAVLLGGNVLVKKGTDVGGDFRHVRACRSASQLACVMAFSTYNDTPPANSIFGRPSAAFGVGPKSLAGLQVLCTNPAALSGGAAPLDTVLPGAPFAPGTTIGALTTQIGFPAFHVSSPWVEAPGVYTGQCSTEGGASVLRIAGSVADAPVLRPLADATWGLHLTDANIALGDLIRVVDRQAQAYLAKAKTRTRG